MKTLPTLSWIFLILLIVCSTTACDDPVETGMRQIKGSVWYRERIMPPPDALVQVTLEDVAQMDAPSKRIAETRFKPRGSPPWAFTLQYDPKIIEKRGRYALRAHIEADGRLIFTSTEYIPAFGGPPEKPVEIMVSMVLGR